MIIASHSAIPHTAIARLRVLFVINSLSTGGAEKQVLTLLEHLDSERFTLGLVYLRRREELLPLVPAARLAHVSCSDSTSYIDLRAIGRLARQIDAFEPDIVVCTNTWSLLNVSLARPAARRTFRLAEVFHTTTLRTLKQRWQMKMHHPLFARSDLLVYVCNTQREYWRARGLRAKADTVVYNGIDAGRYTDVWSPEQKLALRRSLGFSADDFVVGLCAVFRPEKAHGDLLKAIAALRAQGIPAVALFVGDGPERPHIENEVRRLGLAQHVHITGMIEDVRPYLAIADVMTLVSHAIETFSLAALEAMAMGKPMVMTRVGGAEELVRDGHNGLLFATGNIEALTQHLSMLANTATRSAFGAAAQAIVRDRFTTQHMTEEFAACLWQLASNDTYMLSQRESGSAASSFVQTHSARS